MHINDEIRMNSWAKLEYYDPAKILREFRKIELQITGAQMDEKVKTLRTPLLKKHKQRREAALLCYGLGKCLLNTTVWFSPTEDSDYDFVAMWRSETIEHYAPVQLKEWVPHHINPHLSLHSLISGLNKYKSSEDITVGIYVNRTGSFNFSEITVPNLNLAALWLFGGSITTDNSKWFLYGNVLSDRQYYEFTYPV